MMVLPMAMREGFKRSDGAESIGPAETVLRLWLVLSTI